METQRSLRQKKNLGAFYTPAPYAAKALELLRQAIARVPAGNDYIILDRCAGIGNLEQSLTSEELSHCILSTIEYEEYRVLAEGFTGRIRHLIPERLPAPCALISEADALTEEYLQHPVIHQYLEDPHCSVILLENPPFAEVHGSEKNMAGTWKSSYLYKEMKKVLPDNVSDDIGNVFIWSCFRYYLRQETDSYIVFFPVKYWKSQGLVNKKFLGGFGFNRRHFNTNIDACIMCALWTNREDPDSEEILLDGYDLDPEGKLIACGPLPVKRIHSSYTSVYYDKRKSKEDEKGIVCYSDGFESIGRKLSLRPRYHCDMICYLAPKGVGFDKPDLNCTLTTCAFYNGHGFYVYRDNFLTKMPLFCASRYVVYNRSWTERARIMKSADGAERFRKAVESGVLEQFLLKCLLFTCLDLQNHCCTFRGSDGRFYRNELCLDDTNGETAALQELKKLRQNEIEKSLFSKWKKVLLEAKKLELYDPTLTYGLYQIFFQLDTSKPDPASRNRLWDHKELHAAIGELKGALKEYYLNEIVPTLFEYEFLK